MCTLPCMSRRISFSLVHLNNSGKKPRPARPVATAQNIDLSRGRSSANCNSFGAFHFLPEQISIPAPAAFASLDVLYCNTVNFVALNSSTKLLIGSCTVLELPYRPTHNQNRELILSSNCSK